MFEEMNIEAIRVQRGIRCDTTVHIDGHNIPVYVIASAEVSEGDEVTGEIIEVRFMVGLWYSSAMYSLAYLHPSKLTFPVLFSEKCYAVLLETIHKVVNEQVPDAVKHMINRMTVAEYQEYVERIKQMEN